MHRLAPGCKYDYHLNASLDLHKRSVVLKLNIKSATQSAKSVCRTPPIGVPYFYRGFASDT